MHKVTGRWRLGLLLSLITAFCWGVLPIALKVMLERMDPATITWYRVLVASSVTALVLAMRGGLPKLAETTRRSWLVLAVCLVGLTGNWVLYVAALRYTTPGVNQTVVQLSPLFLLIGGVFIYKEPFSRWQWLGFTSLVGGLVLFFNRRLPELMDIRGGLGLGVILVLCSSLLWATYALAQKTLLKRMTSPQILLMLYVGATIVVLPFARLGDIRTLDPLRAGVLAFCCVNTLVGYGAFAEALDHWEVSRVSAVIAIAPIFTFLGMRLTSYFVPGLLEPEPLTALTIAGALIVITGSALSALGQRRLPELNA